MLHVGLPMHDFLLVFNKNLWPGSAPLLGKRLNNMNGDLKLTFQGHIMNVKSEAAVRPLPPLYDYMMYLLVPDVAHSGSFTSTSFQNVSKLNFYLSRLHKVNLMVRLDSPYRPMSYYWHLYTSIPCTV